MKDFEKLIEIARRKSLFDEGNDWSNGSETYLSEIKKEVDEVVEEVPKSRVCYLEDELGDVLWDYLNAVIALEKEQGVQLSSVLKRASQKYDERVSGIESGESWKDVKTRQKVRLEEEQKLKSAE
ncbi:MazG nucleotide pyrophosphohydrolase domain-containing protein [Vibrio hannami]|uniref:MazG nucleotide pyrophosphohydrolase domain-containing protein n=1 Tax=Vibrio hannami TaxID=2717094 RepID=UPI002410B2A6|nr:MazG nucleotide pyrophosphohydrolase domain-containing protein [Vibrio hannami]MDG3086470.1 MazG nucleotide pyrophosphohydrolase domain-containing protein [Vibrio hannami]